MKTTSVIGLLLAAAMLASCGGGSGGSGGGDGGNDQPLQNGTGRLAAGGASGVRYTTPSGSGYTDSNGTFAYQPGETVVFAIGGIELGRVPGASTITLFTLAGQSAPSNERALRLELDLASRRATPFVRAVNLQRLLIALDADHDPANGFDVRAQDANLATATLDLNSKLDDFVERLDRLAPGLTRNVPRWGPVAWLYRGAGLRLAAHTWVQRESRYGTGPVQGIETREFSSGGLLAERTDVDARTSTPTVRRSATYDSLGRQLTESFWVDERFDSQYSSRYTWTTAYSYDARGNLVRQRQETDQLLDGTIDRVDVQETSFDANDRAVRLVTMRLDPVSDLPLSRIIEKYEYDARGNKIRSLRATSDTEEQFVEFQTATYDSSDRLTAQVVHLQFDPDWTPSYTETHQVNRSADGLTVELLIATDKIHYAVPREISRNVYEYSSNGDLRATLFESDHHADGVLTLDRQTSYEYDSSGRILRQEDETSYGSELYVNRFDDIGNRLEQYAEFRGISGELSRREFRTATFGPDGALEEDVLDNLRSQLIGDYTDQAFAQGVSLLAQEYLSYDVSRDLR